MPNEHEVLRQAIASSNGFDLYCHYGERDAAKMLKLHPVTLKKRRLEKRISYVRMGERNVGYLGIHIADFFIENIQWHNPKPATKPSKSETGNSASAKTATTGMRAHMTRPPSAADVSALARQTFQ